MWRGRGRDRARRGLGLMGGREGGGGAIEVLIPRACTGVDPGFEIGGAQNARVSA